MKILTLVISSILLAAGASAQHSIQHAKCNGVVHGVVFGQDGQPAKGIRLVVWPLGVDLGVVLPQTETDETGAYRFEKLCPGRYTVIADDETAGYPTSTPMLNILLYGNDRIAEVKLTTKHTEAEFRVNLPPRAGLLRIQLVNRETKAAIPKMQAEFKLIGKRKHSWRAIWDKSTFKENDILVPPDKDFLLHVTAPGFREWDESVGRGKVIRVPGGTRTTLIVELESLR